MASEPRHLSQRDRGSSRGRRPQKLKALVHPTHQERPKTSRAECTERQGTAWRGALCLQGPLATPSDASQASHTGTDEVDRTMDRSHFSETPLSPVRNRQSVYSSMKHLIWQAQALGRQNPTKDDRRCLQQACGGLGTLGVLPAAARGQRFAASTL